tara:strand:+ start:3713 stop:4015 length:303 start_codon:yes stop_codon:yes gene_type:complete
MSKLNYILSLLFLAGCNTSPVIIPDTTSDSPVMLKLKHDILSGDKIVGNWGWILWYLPIVFLVVAWAWKEFFGRKRDNAAPKTPKAAPVSTPNTVDLPTP